MNVLVSALVKGDKIIINDTTRTVTNIGPGPGMLTRLALDNGEVRLCPPGTTCTLCKSDLTSPDP